MDYFSIYMFYKNRAHFSYFLNTYLSYSVCKCQIPDCIFITSSFTKHKNVLDILWIPYTLTFRCYLLVHILWKGNQVISNNVSIIFLIYKNIPHSVIILIHIWVILCINAIVLIVSWLLYVLLNIKMYQTFQKSPIHWLTHHYVFAPQNSSSHC